MPRLNSLRCSVEIERNKLGGYEAKEQVEAEEKGIFNDEFCIRVKGSKLELR
jgi:hypothetical protein